MGLDLAGWWFPFPQKMGEGANKREGLKAPGVEVSWNTFLTSSWKVICNILYPKS